MRRLATRALAALTGLLVGAIFLAVAFRGTPPAAVLERLAAGHWGLAAILVLGATAGFVYAKTARWQLLLGGGARGALFAPVLAGLALNALVPHSGEFVRALSLQQRGGRAATAVLSSIVAERLFDLFGVLILAALALGSITASAEIATALRLIGAVAALFAALIVLVLASPERVTRLFAALVRPLPARAGSWLQSRLAEAIEGLAPVRSPSTSLRVLAWSLLQWVMVAVAVHGCGAVLGLEFGAAASALVVVGIVVAFLLPNAPGYAGSVQIAFLVTLAPLGVSEAAALAASVVYQLLMVLPLVIAGLALVRSSLAKP